jgi:hypothetical protein
MTHNELANLPIEMLEAALRSARDREAEEAKARWPKCRCGKPITQVCYPVISYVFRHVFDRQGRTSVGFEEADTQDTAPGECGIDDNVAWGACDDEACTTREWALIAYNDLSWGG